MTDNVITLPAKHEDEDGQKVVACGECESHQFAFVVKDGETFITCLGCGTIIGRASISEANTTH